MIIYITHPGAMGSLLSRPRISSFAPAGAAGRRTAFDMRKKQMESEDRVQPEGE